MNYSQRELLSEGFWNKFASAAGSVGRAAVGVGKLAAKVAAPELYEYGKKKIDTVKQLNKDLIKDTTPTSKYLQNKFAQQGFKVISVRWVQQLENGVKPDEPLYDIVYLKPVMTTDPNNPSAAPTKSFDTQNPQYDRVNKDGQSVMSIEKQKAQIPGQANQAKQKKKKKNKNVQPGVLQPGQTP